MEWIMVESVANKVALCCNKGLCIHDDSSYALHIIDTKADHNHLAVTSSGTWNCMRRLTWSNKWTFKWRYTRCAHVFNIIWVIQNR